MKIGIGLPATIPGVSGDRVLEWAKRADSGPFSSLGVLDRVNYPNYEPLITLAASAGVTVRLRLMTTVLLAPLRSTAILAKQAATLDVISGGRFTLGVGVGGREDDFLAAGILFKGRGKRFEEQLAVMKRIWSGEPAVDGVGPVGPPPNQQGGPELLIGASTPVAIRRIGRWADGLILPGTPDSVRQAYNTAEESWKAAGRAGKPRLVGGAYYALGPNAEDIGATYIRHYYAFSGPRAEYMVQSNLTTAEAIQSAVQGFSEIGMDEIILWPTIPELDQVDRLADIVG